MAGRRVKTDTAGIVGWMDDGLDEEKIWSTLMMMREGREGRMRIDGWLVDGWMGFDVVRGVKLGEPKRAKANWRVSRTALLCVCVCVSHA